jgi:Flp pilus assembly protein TadD
VNLADLYRARGMEREAEAVLREALTANPKSAPVLHALGLSLIRQRRPAEALTALRDAAKQAPEEPRFAYVYAVALHDSGERGEAIKALAAALQRHPYERDLLVALGMYELEAGRLDGARSRARLLRALEPNDPAFARLATQLEGNARPR